MPLSPDLVGSFYSLSFENTEFLTMSIIRYFSCASTSKGKNGQIEGPITRPYFYEFENGFKIRRELKKLS